MFVIFIIPEPSRPTIRLEVTLAVEFESLIERVPLAFDRSPTDILSLVTVPAPLMLNEPSSVVPTKKLSLTLMFDPTPLTTTLLPEEPISLATTRVLLVSSPPF